METKELLQLILPQELFKYFEVKDFKTDKGQLTFYLEELPEVPSDFPTGDYESKGFHPPIELTDFPIRDRKVILRVRRRKWHNKITGKIHSRKWELATQGTRYTKEFGAFLKELSRH